MDGRVDPPPTVRRFDVDYPDVIGLRRQIYPERGPASSLSGGEMIFGVCGRAGIKLRKKPVRRAGATLRWGVNDPSEHGPLGLALVERLHGTDFASDELHPGCR